MNIEKKKKILVVVLAIFVIPFFEWIHYLLKFEYDFTLFYITIFGFLTWHGGRRIGILLAVIAIIAWYFIHFIDASIPIMGPVLWQAATTLVLALITIFVVIRLKESLENEKRLSRIDSLTGLPNRRNFEEIAEVQYNWCKRKMTSVSLAFIDVDNFKEVNDTLGHDEGDRLLKEIANSIKESVREVDLVARMGGDEFILFLPETDEFEAKKLLTRVQGEAKIIADENKWPISFSIGVVTDHLSHKNIESLVKRADKLMYEIKQSGKNGIKSELIL